MVLSKNCKHQKPWNYLAAQKIREIIQNGKNVLNLEVVELVLVQCNLVDNEHEEKSEVLYTFTPNKFYAYLLNVEPSNLVFLKTYNTEFDEMIITLMDQNGGPLEIEDKVDLALVFNK